MPLFRIWPSFLGVFSCIACGNSPATDPAPGDPGATPVAVPTVVDDLKLVEAKDINDDPGVVEINLEARVAPIELTPGIRTEVWTYNGAVPGPLIRIRQGDRLIVRFTNNLPEATTVHWHGLRIPAAMDGVPGHSQAPVAPGATFSYDFTVPDAGMYWYHPHHHSAAQLGDGMYGAIIVADPAEPPGLGDEIPLVLSDISLDQDGTLSTHDQGGHLGTLFGREGTVILVNGRVLPRLVVQNGVRQRWRIVNASRSRYFQMALSGHTFVRIGGDAGPIAAPIESERLLVIPGQRVDVLIVPRGRAGSELPLRWVPYDRGYGTAFLREEELILRVRFSGDPSAISGAMPPVGRAVPALDVAGATAVAVELTKSYDTKEFLLGVNGKAFGGKDEIQAHVGQTQVWTIGNEIDWDHPFHLHGFFFQVLDDDGQPLLPPEWRDTVNIPVGKKVKIAVKYDDRPGMWMFHCHILDHADAGMMAMLHVKE